MIVVIEGLDATGKSTLCKALATYLHGLAYNTPPEQIRRQRNEVDLSASPEKSFAFYWKGIEIATEEIREMSKYVNVVVDRHWISTVATHLAMGVDIESKTMSSYGVADLTVLLTVGETVQAERLQKRGMTPGDQKLRKLYGLVDKNFRELVVNYCHPHVIVDTDFLSLFQVFSRAISVISEHSTKGAYEKVLLST